MLRSRMLERPASRHRRNCRPELGKWQTKDPLGYPDGWNSFAYCNNALVSSYDPFGLAGTLIIVGGGGPSGNMFNLAAQTYVAGNDGEGTVVSANSGAAFISAINNYVAANGTIDSLQIFSHSSDSALYFDQGNTTNNSFYLDGAEGGALSRNVGDLNPSSFSSGAVIALWGCNTAATQNAIAQQIANQTGVTTVGCTGPAAFSGVPGGTPEEGLPDPVPCNYQPVYMVSQYATDSYVSTRPE